MNFLGTLLTGTLFTHTNGVSTQALTVLAAASALLHLWRRLRSRIVRILTTATVLAAATMLLGHPDDLSAHSTPTGAPTGFPAAFHQ